MSECTVSNKKRGAQEDGLGTETVLERCSKARRVHVPEACTHFEPMMLHPDYKLYDINFHEAGMLKANLKHYYDFCLDPATRLSVTTSCFAHWRQNKKTNGAAKVIPAVPAVSNSDSPSTRVFFFDDNINLHLGGASDAQGICNLRDVDTGEFVDFSIGKNGFTADTMFGKTVVHASSTYNNVLVQANILDAMTNLDYFQAIIDRYAKPGERLVVLMDVNGTIVWDDSISTAASNVSQLLLILMFTFAEVQPRPADVPLGFSWKDKPSVSIEKPEDLKSLIKRISNNDSEFYDAFWSLATCEEFVKKLASVADLAWSKKGVLDPAEFIKDFNRNLEQIQKSPMKDGIPQSWLNCYAALAEGGHQVILNSYGIDTFRVLQQIAPDKKSVLQLTANYKLWSQKDMTAWGKMLEA